MGTGNSLVAATSSAARAGAAAVKGATDTVAIKTGSVEVFAKQIQAKGDGLGQDYKEEYKDLKSTIAANGNIKTTFSGEKLGRTALKLMSQKESNNLQSVKEEFASVDKQLAACLNNKFWS